MNLDFFEFGDQGTPIVFLHGWQQDKKSFSALVPYLFKTNHLYLLDLPGFGKSKLPNDNYTSYDYAEEVVEWLKKNKLTEVILVGHSFGGKIATIVANKYPEIISKLILIANSGIPEDKTYYPFLKYLPQPLKKRFSPLFTSSDYKNAGKLLPIFKNVVKENLTTEFAKVNKPTLIIWGKNDRQLPMDMSKQINKLIKNSKLELLPTGHFPFIDKPKEVADLIKNFINL